MAFLANDTVKKILMVLSMLNGMVLALPATGVALPPLALTICAGLASIFAALGITSGGTSGQRSDQARETHAALTATRTVPPKGFARLQVLMALAMFSSLLLLGVSGCAALKGVTISGSVSTDQADVTVTANGQPYSVSVGNHQACLSAPRFVPLDGLGLACQTACGMATADKKGVTLTCCAQPAGTTGCASSPFPIVFAL